MLMLVLECITALVALTYIYRYYKLLDHHYTLHSVLSDVSEDYYKVVERFIKLRTAVLMVKGSPELSAEVREIFEESCAVELPDWVESDED